MRPLRTAISQRGPNNDPSQSRARRSTKRVPAPFTTASTQYRAGCCSASRSQASSCSWGSVWRSCRARRFFMGYFSCCSFPTRYTCAGGCASSAIARREFAPRASSLSRSNCNARTAPLSGNIVRCVAPRWNYATRIDLRRDGTLIGAAFAGERLEGVLCGKVRRDGANATSSLLHLILHSRYAEHTQLIMLQGIAFAGFNVVDIHGQHKASDTPVVVVARRKPDLER